MNRHKTNEIKPYASSNTERCEFGCANQIGNGENGAIHLQYCDRFALLRSTSSALIDLRYCDPLAVLWSTCDIVISWRVAVRLEKITLYWPSSNKEEVVLIVIFAFQYNAYATYGFCSRNQFQNICLHCILPFSAAVYEMGILKKLLWFKNFVFFVMVSLKSDKMKSMKFPPYKPNDGIAEIKRRRDNNVEKDPKNRLQMLVDQIIHVVPLRCW